MLSNYRLEHFWERIGERGSQKDKGDFRIKELGHLPPKNAVGRHLADQRSLR